MAKNLKRKNEKEDNKTKKVLKKNKKVEDDIQLDENDNVISSKASHISDVKLQEIIKKLREKGLYYDDLDEFLKSDS